MKGMLNGLILVVMVAMAYSCMPGKAHAQNLSAQEAVDKVLKEMGIEKPVKKPARKQTGRNPGFVYYETYEAEHNEPWPLIYEYGVLSCVSDAVTMMVDGKWYALNGIAKSRQPQIPYISTITKKVPMGEFTINAPTSLLLQKGLTLCKQTRMP